MNCSDLTCLINYAKLLSINFFVSSMTDNELKYTYSFQIHITLEEEFMPVLNPNQGYDSKRETSMVGLENLGATCYLNALLQVRTVRTCKFLSVNYMINCAILMSALLCSFTCSVEISYVGAVALV